MGNLPQLYNVTPYQGLTCDNKVGTKDPSNAFNPAFRGLQHTDAQGVAQFTTVFPGYYAGRTPHIHVLAHLNSNVAANGHFSGGTNSHVGQVFFDQSLITEVIKVAPYNTGGSLVTNAKDSIFLQEAATSDPVVVYSLLGSTVADGLFGWVAFGVNVGTSKSVKAAANLAATVTVSNAGQQVTGVP